MLPTHFAGDKKLRLSTHGPQRAKTDGMKHADGDHIVSSD
jgi:hypothetical protein